MQILPSEIDLYLTFRTLKIFYFQFTRYFKQNQLCIFELKTYREFSVGATDSKIYLYLDLYGSEEGRHPYLFYYQNKLAEFSFIRHTRSTESMSSQVAEFYVIPRKRGIGIGQADTFAIFEMFPGNWELQVNMPNRKAPN